MDSTAFIIEIAIALVTGVTLIWSLTSPSREVLVILYQSPQSPGKV
ncbi:hypothetical protein LAY57_16495 [Argonema antarcticum A004/B2]|nr:hypothetical protein [Argonema antarcticum A004/B2]